MEVRNQGPLVKLHIVDMMVVSEKWLKSQEERDQCPQGQVLRNNGPQLRLSLS